MTSFVRKLGSGALGILEILGSYGMFLLTAFFWLFGSPLKFKRVLEQIIFIGVKSTVIVLLTGAFTGMVFALQVFYALSKFGGESLLGPTVALSLIRELGPVVSALMITGRAGSALASEIGIMRITEQIDALEIMAVNPLSLSCCSQHGSSGYFISPAGSFFQHDRHLGRLSRGSETAWGERGHLFRRDEQFCRYEGYHDGHNQVPEFRPHCLLGMLLQGVFYGIWGQGRGQGYNAVRCHILGADSYLGLFHNFNFSVNYDHRP